MLGNHTHLGVNPQVLPQLQPRGERDEVLFRGAGGFPCTQPHEQGLEPTDIVSEKVVHRFRVPVSHAHPASSEPRRRANIVTGWRNAQFLAAELVGVAFEHVGYPGEVQVHQHLARIPAVVSGLGLSILRQCQPNDGVQKLKPHQRPGHPSTQAIT